MFEQDRLDEEVKKKKRRVLAVLLVLMLGTAAASSSVIEQAASSAAVPKATDAPVHTPVPTSVPLPTEEPATTSAPTSTPRPTATATHIPIPPTATEEFGGAGGPDASFTPTAEPTGAVVPTDAVAPTEASAPTQEPTATTAPTATPQPTATDVPPSPTPTPEEPGRLPVTGTSTGGSGRLILGLASISLGVLLLAVGFVLREEKTPPMISRPALPATDDAPSAQEESERSSETGTDAPVRLALGLVVAASVLMLIAGYALHRARRQ